MGEHAKANELVLALSTLDDETGEYDALTAARLMKEGKFDPALAAIESAKTKPKANRVNLRLLETAIKIEKGDFSSLEDTCKLAIAVGLDAGAHSLRARAEIRLGHWSQAEAELAAIGALNYYDKLLLLRALDLKMADMEVIADPALHKNVVNQFNELLVEMRRHGEGDWFDYA
ncbi:hypothetical protein K678_17276 [Magnetospirillum fulvum MGU-K5]|uniref:TPR repeat-containing protein n=1 Tax=Magnetospirillum fulvum MGU-K5 TaxID=1316936 RepID=S9TDA4_MAGFU|nr:hypothetical protein K678_17276 [Magnetospirillum fulvum MGU-K5]